MIAPPEPLQAHVDSIPAGRFLATRPVIARALSRWGHVILPVVLIGIGLLILIEGGVLRR